MLMPVPSRNFRNPNARKRALIAMAVAGLVCISAAIRWIGKDSSPALRESPVASQNAATSVDEENVTPLSLPDERDAPPIVREGADASTFYKDAFALYDALSAEERKMLNPKEKVDADQAAALFEKIQPLMELLRQAAKADYCDWGLGEPSVDRKSPLSNKATGLANVAVWSANYRFATDQEGAVDDIAVLSPFGHHVSDTLIAYVLRMGIEAWSTGFFREHAAEFNDIARAKASAVLAESTVDRDLQNALAGEVAIHRSSYKKYIAQTADERSKLMDALEQIGVDFGDETDPNSVRLRAQAEAIFRDPAKFTAEMNFVQKVQEQMFEVMSWPDAQFDAWMGQFSPEHISEHPIAVPLMDAHRSIRRTLQRVKISSEMMRVGLAVFESGPEVVGQSRDPVTGRSFTYVPKADGFELQSAVHRDGKPITMSFDLPK